MGRKKRISSGAMHGPTPSAAQCDGKFPYPNGAQAYRVAKKSIKHKRGGLAVYHCPHCGKYHIGGSHI